LLVLTNDFTPMPTLRALKQVAMVQFHMKLAPFNLAGLDHSKPLIVALLALHRICYILSPYLHKYLRIMVFARQHRLQQY
jgi:hypothetical protein